MLKKTYTYIDFNGTERTEDFYFNLNEAEIMDMQLTTVGGLTELVDSIIKAKEGPAIAKLFKDLVLKSYGKKSADGKRFEKSQAIRDEFEQSPVFPKIYMELALDDAAGANFVNGILPSDLAQKVQGELAKQNKQIN